MSASGSASPEAANGLDPRPRAVSFAAVALMAITAFTLAAGFALKANCTHRPWDGRQWRTSCVNDVLLLYYLRGLNIDRSFPPALEYPAGTDLYVGAANALSHSDSGFVDANAVGLALAGLATTAALIATVGARPRVLYFALGPSLALYAFNNWDLLAVALATLGLLAYRRDHDGWAGVAIGLGAAVKLYPALLLPALVLATWRRATDPERRSRLARLVAGFAVGAGVPNLLVYVLSPTAWWFFWRFQSERFPNPETSWFMVFRHLHGFPTPDAAWERLYPTVANLGSAGFLVVAAALLIFA